MSQQYVAVQGALCSCLFGDFPDKLKVLSHFKYYASDSSGSSKLVATTMEIGATTFEKNTFGQCKLQPIPSGFKPCQIVVTKWDSFYSDVELGNGGKILTETSRATCPINGSPCISFTNHGQSMAGFVNGSNSLHSDIHGQLNPLVEAQDLDERKKDIQEVTVT